MVFPVFSWFFCLTVQATNFANPVYESMYSDAGGASSAASEEKKGLLQAETSLSSSSMSSHPLEPLKDHPLADHGESFT